MIRKIAIRNFKSIRECEVVLKKMNVLIGLNGVGKSSFIQSILLPRQTFLNNMIEECLVLNDSRFVSIGALEDAKCESRSDGLMEFQFLFDKKEVLKLSYEIENEADLKSELVKIRKENSIFLDNYKTPLFTKKEFEYLSAERVSPKNTHKVSQFEVVENFSLGKNGEFTTHFLNVMQQSNGNISIKALRHQKSIKFDNDDYNSENPVNNFDFITNTTNWLAEVSPGVKFKANYLSDLDVSNLDIFFDRADSINSKKYKSTNVGFGITYVLPVIVSILKARKGDLLIVENPESHIHPLGQYKLGELFGLAAQNGVQIFLETHSDHVLDGISKVCNDNLNIISFNKKSNCDIVELTTFRSSESLGDIFSTAFFSNRRFEIEKQLRKHSKPLILTEGKSDCYILKEAWKKLFTENECPFHFYPSGIGLDLDSMVGSADTLRREIEFVSSFISGRKMIALFDNDFAGSQQFKALSKTLFQPYSENSLVRKHLRKNIYALLLPIPSFRSIYDVPDLTMRLLAIEHYFSDKILDQFDLKGDSIYINELFRIKSSSKSKIHFSSQCIELDSSHFSAFKPLFEMFLELLD